MSSGRARDMSGHRKDYTISHGCHQAEIVRWHMIGLDAGHVITIGCQHIYFQGKFEELFYRTSKSSHCSWKFQIPTNLSVTSFHSCLCNILANCIHAQAFNMSKGMRKSIFQIAQFKTFFGRELLLPRCPQARKLGVARKPKRLNTQKAHFAAAAPHWPDCGLIPTWFPVCSAFATRPCP